MQAELFGAISVYYFKVKNFGAVRGKQQAGKGFP